MSLARLASQDWIPWASFEVYLYWDGERLEEGRAVITSNGRPPLSAVNSQSENFVFLGKSIEFWWALPSVRNAEHGLHKWNSSVSKSLPKGSAHIFDSI